MTMMGRQRGVFIGFLHRQQQDNHRSLGLMQVEGGAGVVLASSGNGGQILGW